MDRFPDAFFLPVEEEEGGGQRLYLYHAPLGQVKGVVLYIHPFAEEMNKSRRMAAMQSRALAQAGFGVLQCDLLGCGDSSGDFADATWDAWIRDVARAAAWLRSQQPRGDMWLWGLRAGCLLAAEAARRQCVPDCHFLFWAPVTVGKAHLQQFLRIKMAASLIAASPPSSKAPTRSPSASAGEDESGIVEVAGYALAPGLRAGLGQASVAPPSPPKGHSPHRMEWFEVSSRDDATLSPAATNQLRLWQERGFASRSHAIKGAPFWQTTEIEDAPELLEATITAMSQPSSPQSP